MAGAEGIWLSIQTIEGKIVVCYCYIPPNQAEFWDEFDVVIDHVKQVNVSSYMFILRDMNVDLKTSNGNKLTYLCFEHNLQFLANEPTRITTSQTILDQILTNAPNFVSDVSVLPPLSANDHCTVALNSQTTHIDMAGV